MKNPTHLVLVFLAVPLITGWSFLSKPTVTDVNRAADKIMKTADSGGAGPSWSVEKTDWGKEFIAGTSEGYPPNTTVYPACVMVNIYDFPENASGSGTIEFPPEFKKTLDEADEKAHQDPNYSALHDGLKEGINERQFDLYFFKNEAGELVYKGPYWREGIKWYP